MVKWIHRPSSPHSRPGQVPLPNACRSAGHWVHSQVMTKADNPNGEPNNSVSAGTKSELDSPGRYSSASTAATLGLRQHQHGRSTFGTASTHRSPGPLTGHPPAGARLDLAHAGGAGAGRAGPLRTTSRWPCSSSSSAWTASILWAPSQKSPSSSRHSPAWAASSGITLSIAALLPRRRSPRRRPPYRSGCKVRRALMPGTHPQVSTIAPGLPLRRVRTLRLAREVSLRTQAVSLRTQAGPVHQGRPQGRLVEVQSSHDIDLEQPELVIRDQLDPQDSLARRRHAAGRPGCSVASSSGSWPAGCTATPAGPHGADGSDGWGVTGPVPGGLDFVEGGLVALVAVRCRGGSRLQHLVDVEEVLQLG